MICVDARIRIVGELNIHLFCAWICFRHLPKTRRTAGLGRGIPGFVDEKYYSFIGVGSIGGRNLWPPEIQMRAEKFLENLHTLPPITMFPCLPVYFIYFPLQTPGSSLPKAQNQHSFQPRRVLIGASACAVLWKFQWGAWGRRSSPGSGLGYQCSQYPLE